jgi:hypothetical protein
MPLSTLRLRPWAGPLRRLRMTRGHRGLLALRCTALSSASPCRFIPAHPPDPLRPQPYPHQRRSRTTRTHDPTTTTTTLNHSTRCLGCKDSGPENGPNDGVHLPFLPIKANPARRCACSRAQDHSTRPPRANACFRKTAPQTLRRDLAVDFRKSAPLTASRRRRPPAQRRAR